MKVINTIICYDYPMYQLNTGEWVTITQKGFQYLKPDNPILVAALKGLVLGLEELFIQANPEGTVMVQVARCPTTKKWFQRGDQSGSWVEFNPEALEKANKFPACSYSSMWGDAHVSTINTVKDASFFWKEFKTIE